MAGQGTTNKLSVKEWAAPLAISAIAFVILFHLVPDIRIDLLSNLA